MPGLPVNQSLMQQRELDWFQALMDHQDLATIETAEQEYEWTLRVLRDVFKLDDDDINKPPEGERGKGTGDPGDGEGQSGDPVYGTVKYSPNVDDHGTGESEGCKILYEDTYGINGAFIPCEIRERTPRDPLHVQPTNLSKQVSRLIQIRPLSRPLNAYL